MLRRPYAIKPPLGAQINLGHPLADGLGGCWIMSEGGGLYVFDSSGRNNKGTLVSGPTWVPGKIGSALSFDGSNAYINLGNPSALSFQSSFTVVALVKASALDGLRYIFGKGYDGSTESLYLRLNSGVLQVGAYDTSDHNTSWSISGWNVGEWHLISGLYTGTVWQIYFDGALKASTTDTKPASNAVSVCIGGTIINGTPSRFWLGLIDLVNVFNRALRPEEIQWLYTNPYVMFEQPRRGKWFYVEEAPPGGLSIPVAMAQYRQRWN